MWQHKPAGFISYGMAGGVRAVEHLGLVLSEVKAVPVASQVALSVFEDFSYADLSDPTTPATVSAREHQTAGVLEMVAEVLAFSGALVPFRAPAPTPAWPVYG